MQRVYEFVFIYFSISRENGTPTVKELKKMFQEVVENIVNLTVR